MILSALLESKRGGVDFTKKRWRAIHKQYLAANQNIRRNTYAAKKQGNT
jgi:hypothetical protein